MNNKFNKLTSLAIWQGMAGILVSLIAVNCLNGGVVNPIKDCPPLSAPMCKASKLCTYDATTDKCSPAAQGVAGQCAAIQDKTACNNDASCKWDDTNSKCKDKVASGRHIHTWKKIKLSNTLDGTGVLPQHFVRSGDKRHLYAFDESKAGQQGLYHSADAGANWTKIVSLRGKPMATAANDAILDLSRGGQAADLIMQSTKTGLAVAHQKKLFILQGVDVKWGINTRIHHTATGNADEVADIPNANITFVNVVKTKEGGRPVEVVIFGQDEDLVVWLHQSSANFNAAPIRFLARNQSNGLDLTANPKWTAAANAQNGNLLLGSTTGVWEFLADNTDPTNAANFAKATSDAAVIFPEIGQLWAGGIAPNLDINTLGSFLNGGTQHYYVGLHMTAPLNGGLAHINGPQGAGHAELIIRGKDVSKVIEYDGTHFLLTNQGLLAINTDGSLNPAKNFSFTAFKNDKNEMMEDSSAVNFIGRENNLKSIIGDADDSWLVIEGVGLYHRLKTQGKPRP